MTCKQFFRKWRYDDVLCHSMDTLIALCEYYGFNFDIVDDLLEDEREAAIDWENQTMTAY